MIRQDFHLLATPMRPILCVLTLLMFLAGSVAPALAMSSGRGGALPQPLPLFPPDNWWNLDYQRLAGGFQLDELHLIYQ